MIDKQIIIDDQNKTIHRLQQECTEKTNIIIALGNKLQAKEQECEELSKGYAELTDIVAPYMDDFTGYNEELGGFDIVLCVKQLLEQLDQLKADNDELKNKINSLICSENCYKYKQAKKLKQTLAEIKEIVKEQLPTVNYNFAKSMHPEMFNCYEQILQKISEVE